MEISDEAVNKIRKLRDYYDGLDIHLNSNDSYNDKRKKDINFGSSIAIERICEILNIG